VLIVFEYCVPSLGGDYKRDNSFLQWNSRGNWD
jgi:hypothetical protein